MWGAFIVEGGGRHLFHALCALPFTKILDTPLHRSIHLIIQQIMSEILKSHYERRMRSTGKACEAMILEAAAESNRTPDQVRVSYKI